MLLVDPCFLNVVLFSVRCHTHTCVIFILFICGHPVCPRQLGCGGCRSVGPCNVRDGHGRHCALCEVPKCAAVPRCFLSRGVVGFSVGANGESFFIWFVNLPDIKTPNFRRFKLSRAWGSSYSEGLPLGGKVISATKRIGTISSHFHFAIIFRQNSSQSPLFWTKVKKLFPNIVTEWCN